MTLLLIEKWNDCTDFTKFEHLGEWQEYKNRFIERKEKLSDYQGYQLFNSYQEAIDNCQEAARYLFNGLLQLLDQYLAPKPKYFRIYAKDKDQKRFSPIGPDCQQVTNLIYAAFWGNKEDALSGAKIVAKYYDKVEIRQV